MKTMNFEQMQQVNGGGAAACLAGSTFATAMFFAGAALATTITAGAAGVAIIGWYGSIGLSCLL